MKRAAFWHVEKDGKIRCELCPHRCLLADGHSGLCRVRRAEKGVLHAIGYGLVSSAHMDPIEKKPLYHFHPTAWILSIGGWGCNFRCAFCQNWTISQTVQTDGSVMTPGEVVHAALRERSVGIAYTYNEPCIGFEYVRDCARLARDAGLVNVLVTNGFINPEPAAELLKWVDAVNIDIKSMEDAFYREQCGGRLGPVLSFAEQAASAGCHVEITNLVIPGLNDADNDFDALSSWIAETLGRSVPLHLSAYHPQYRMDRPATPSTVLEPAREICKQRLDYVYLGNVHSARGGDTHCPQCGATLIERSGYTTHVTGIECGCCATCGRVVAVVAAG